MEITAVLLLVPRAGNLGSPKTSSSGGSRYGETARIVGD
jgi:hypothetical protein